MREAVGRGVVVDTAVVVGAVGKAVIRVRVGVKVESEEGPGVEDKHRVGDGVKEGWVVAERRVVRELVGVSWAVKEKEGVEVRVEVDSPEKVMEVEAVEVEHAL